MRISAYGSKELQAVIIAMRPMKGALASEIKKATRNAVAPIWSESVRGNTRTAADVRVLSATARTRVTGSNVYLESGNSAKRLSGGGALKQLANGMEFGADREFSRTVQGRRGSTRYSMKRRTQRQLPPRTRKGRVVYPAAADAIPRLASLWVQTTIRTFFDILERK